MIEDRTTDAGIVPARPFVGAAQHHDLVLPVPAIGVRQRLQQFPAGNAPYVRKNRQLQRPKGIRQHLPQPRRIPQNPRIGRLPHHRGKFHVGHAAKAVHKRGRQRRRCIQPHRRQLGSVPHQDEPAVRPGPHERHQVFQQISRPEAVRKADQRHLVHNKQRAPRLVERERKRANSLCTKRLLPINMLVNGRSRMPRILRQHLGRPTGRRQQHGRNLQRSQARHHSSHGRGLTGPRIPVHHQDIPVVRGQKSGNRPQQPLLARGGRIRKRLPEKWIKLH